MNLTKINLIIRQMRGWPMINILQKSLCRILLQGYNEHIYNEKVIGTGLQYISENIKQILVISRATSFQKLSGTSKRSFDREYYSPKMPVDR